MPIPSAPTRRPLSAVIRKAPTQLWQKHRKNLETAEMDPSSKLKDATVESVPRSEQLKALSSSSYNVCSVRDTVMPLFAPKSSSSSASDDVAGGGDDNNPRPAASSFNFYTNSFVWPLYKPPHVAMHGVHRTSSSNTSTATAPSVEEYVKKQFSRAAKEFVFDGQNQQQQAQQRNTKQDATTKSTSSGNSSFFDNPFETAAAVASQQYIDRLQTDDGSSMRKKKQKEEFLGALDSINATSAVVRDGTREGTKKSQKNHPSFSASYLKHVATACEIPFSLALGFAKAQRWHYDFSTVLAPDVSGVVPLSVAPTTDAAWMLRNHICCATFEAVLQGHVPRALPQKQIGTMASSASSSSDALMIDRFELMVSDELQFPSSLQQQRLRQSSGRGRRSGREKFFLPTYEQDQEMGIEISNALVVRHGYYLQEPVSVVRWDLSGVGCAAVSPRQILESIFLSTASSSSSSASSSHTIVGHPDAKLTRKFDIPCPMVVLRSIALDENVSMMTGGTTTSSSTKKKGGMSVMQKYNRPSRNSNNSATSGKGRVIGMPFSPYASEEMIASQPNAQLMAIRRASLMDGIWMR